MRYIVDAVLTSAPVWLAFVLFAIVPASAAVLLHDQFRRLVPPERLIPHHEVAGFLVAIVGLLYAVVLAFLVAAAWTTFDGAQRTADTEASDVAETFASAEILPEPTRTRVRSFMADYAFQVRDREWSMLVDGKQDPEARRQLFEAFTAVANIPVPKNTGVAQAIELESAQRVVLDKLRDVTGERRQRLLDAGRHIPNELYLALVLGWLNLTAFIFLFGCPRVLQLTMTALVTAMIGLLFAVIVEFDYPYGHGIRVSNDAWTLIIDNNRLDQFRSGRPAR